VRSSTFSSSQVPASAPAGRVWWVALLVAAAVLLGLELGWRQRGFRPEPRDTPELWSLVRSRASEGDGRPVVLLGSSRFRTDVVPEELSKALGGQPVLELAINASSSLPVLEELAADERFRGRVLCEVSPTMFFSVGYSETRTKPAACVEQHRHRPLAANWETRLRVPLQERLAVLHPDLFPKSVIHPLLLNRSLPRPNPVWMLADRSYHREFDPAKLAEMRAEWVHVFRDTHGVNPEPGELEALLERVASSVERIRSRGGDVVFVRPVTSGTVRRIEDERFPRAVYWDRLIQRTGKGVTFEDVPALAHLEAPDESHLDYAGALEFSRFLAGVLSPAPPSGVAEDVP
jgi:hypothetical protein